MCILVAAEGFRVSRDEKTVVPAGLMGFG